MTCDVTLWTQNDVNHIKWNISEDFFCIEPKLSTVVFHYFESSFEYANKKFRVIDTLMRVKMLFFPLL